jgi:glycosyltransferase involved in cell wall biosynthesis
MKLLFIIPSYNGGGAELVFIKLANQLARVHDVSLFVINPKGHHKGRVQKNVVLIESASRKSSRAWIDLYQLCKHERFDKIFATLIFPIILAGIVKIISQSKSKFIARPANIIEMERGEQPIIYMLYLFFLGKFDKIIAQNAEIQEYVKYKLNKPSVLLPNPVERQEVQDARSIGEHFIWVGRISHQKKFDLLVAASTLTDRTIHAFIKPEEADTARKMCEIAGCKNIEVFPFSAEIVKHIGQSQGLIITSLYEGLSNVMLEALSVGTPVITTSFKGGGHEYLNTGNSVYYSSAAELAAILTNPPDFENREKISAEIYKICSSEAVGECYVNI